jgi:XTP/dITP diphosphohydrolase
LLRQRLGNLPLEKRTAHYTCTAALSDPEGTIRAESEGRCCGRIRFDAVGTNGFGYDPLFEVVEYHRTFGELCPALKRCISHRARAMRLIIPQIVKLLFAPS